MSPATPTWCEGEGGDGGGDGGEGEGERMRVRMRVRARLPHQRKADDRQQQARVDPPLRRGVDARVKHADEGGGDGVYLRLGVG